MGEIFRNQKMMSVMEKNQTWNGERESLCMIFNREKGKPCEEMTSE